MRRFYTSILLVLMGFGSAWAQVEVVSVPQIGLGMASSGDDVYISSGPTIFKVDLSAEDPEAVVLLDNLDYMISLQVVGTDLYMGNFDKIFRVDLTASTLEATEIVTGLAYVRGFLLDGNDLYFTQQNGGKVSKIDVTETTPTVVDLVTGLSSATGVAKVGDTLYITRYGVAKISKIDLTADPVTYVDILDTDRTPSGITAIGNYIYYSEFDGDEGEQGKISKMDITQSTLAPQVLVSGFDRAWDLVSYGCNLLYGDPSDRKLMELALENTTDYSTSMMGNTISATQTGASYQWMNCADDSPIEGETGQSFTATASGDYAVIITTGTCADTSECVNLTYVSLDDKNAQGVSLYPNPGQGLINIDLGMLEAVTINVFDTRGQLIHGQEGITTSNYQLDMSAATSGVYIVELSANNLHWQYKLMIR